MISIIKYVRRTSLFLLLFSLIISISETNLFAQTDPELKAKQLFDEGLYEQALPVFKDLVRLYPTDENLNYYLGACLAETEEFSDETYQSLLLAGEKQTKTFYYLGQYFHARSDWGNAEKYYMKFIHTAKKKETKNTRIDELLDLCKKQVNPFQITMDETSTQTTSQGDNNLTAKIDSTDESQPVPLEIPDALKESIIYFQVNALIYYLKIDQFKNESSKQTFANGWMIEQELQSKLNEIKQLREQYANTSDSLKETLTVKILKLEQETYQMNQETRKIYMAANEKEALYWSQASEEEINRFREMINQMQDSIQTAKEVLKRDEMKTELPVIISDTTAVKMIDEIQPDTNNIVYKIQIGAYKRTPPDWVQRLFKKLSVIRRIDQYTDENGVTVYTVGELKKYEDALQMQNQVRMEGIKDAFVAAYNNNKRIKLNDARKLSE